jgi:hypothetical protein
MKENRNTPLDSRSRRPSSPNLPNISKRHVATTGKKPQAASSAYQMWMSARSIATSIGRLDARSLCNMSSRKDTHQHRAPTVRSKILQTVASRRSARRHAAPELGHRHSTPRHQRCCARRGRLDRGDHTRDDRSYLVRYDGGTRSPALGTGLLCVGS